MSFKRNKLEHKRIQSNLKHLDQTPSGKSIWNDIKPSSILKCEDAHTFTHTHSQESSQHHYLNWQNWNQLVYINTCSRIPNTVECIWSYNRILYCNKNKLHTTTWMNFTNEDVRHEKSDIKRCILLMYYEC